MSISCELAALSRPELGGGSTSKGAIRSGAPLSWPVCYAAICRSKPNDLSFPIFFPVRGLSVIQSLSSLHSAQRMMLGRPHFVPSANRIFRVALARIALVISASKSCVFEQPSAALQSGGANESEICTNGGRKFPRLGLRHESPVNFSEFSANTKKLGLTLAGSFH